MPHKLEPQFARNTLLQRLDRFVAKLDNATRLDIDEVIMVDTCRFLIATSSKAEIVPLENVLVRKKPQRSVDRGERDSAINLIDPAMNLVNIRVIP